MLNYLKMPSTWRGIILVFGAVATAFGIPLADTGTIGTIAAGLIEIFRSGSQ